MPTKTFSITAGPEQLVAGPSGTTTTKSLYTGDTFAITEVASTNNEQVNSVYFGFERKSVHTSNAYLNFDTDIPPGAEITAATIDFVSAQTDILPVYATILGLAPGLYSSEVTDLKDSTLAMNCSLNTYGSPSPTIDYDFNSSDEGFVVTNPSGFWGPGPTLSNNPTYLTVSQNTGGDVNVTRTSMGLTSAASNTKIIFKYRLTDLGNSNTWTGFLLWKRTTDTSVSSSRRFDLAEPAVGVWNEVVLDASVEAEWNGTIDSIEFRLVEPFAASANSAVVDIDSFQVGDPAGSFAPILAAQGGTASTYGINCYDGATTHYQALTKVSAASEVLDSVTIRLKRFGTDSSKTAWAEVWGAESESGGNYSPGSLLATSNISAWNSMPSSASDHTFFFSDDQRITWDGTGNQTWLVRLNQSFSPYNSVGGFSGHYFTTYWGSAGTGYPESTTTTSILPDQGPGGVGFSTTLVNNYAGVGGIAVPNGTGVNFVVGEQMRQGPMVSLGGTQPHEGDFFTTIVESVDTSPAPFDAVYGEEDSGLFVMSSTLLSTILPVDSTLLPILGVVSAPSKSGYAYIDSELVKFERLSATSIQILERAVGDTVLANHNIGATLRVDFPGTYNGIRAGTFTGFTKNIYPMGEHVNALSTITTETLFVAPNTVAGTAYSWGSASMTPDFTTDHVINAVQAVVNHEKYTGQLGIKIDGIDDGSLFTFAYYRVWRSANDATGPGPTLTVTWLEEGALDSKAELSALLGGLLSGSSIIDSGISSGSVLDGALTIH